MYTDSWIYHGFTSCNFDLCQRLWWKQNDGWGNDLRKKTWLQVDYLCTDGFNSEILPRGFVLQCQILKNVIFVAYVLNLPLKHIGPIIAHNALENGAWFWLVTDARYIALPLISRYHRLDPTNHDISRVHCSMTHVTRVSLTDMRNIKNAALQAERLLLLSDKSNLLYPGHQSSFAYCQMSVVLCVHRFPMKIENCYIRH